MVPFIPLTTEALWNCLRITGLSLRLSAVEECSLRVTTPMT